jgi:hypothetical protein
MSDRLLLMVRKQYPEGGVGLNLLEAIAEAANEDGNCYLTMGHLAALARITRGATLTNIAKLRDARWIVTDRIMGKGSKLIYQLNIAKLQRSSRPNVNPDTIRSQQDRQTGEAEAGVMRRTALRHVAAEVYAASTGTPRVQDSAQQPEPDVADERPQPAQESAIAPRQGFSDGEWAEFDSFMRSDEAAPPVELQGEKPGATPRQDSQQARVEALVSPEMPVLEGVDAEPGTLEEFAEDVATLMEQAGEAPVIYRPRRQRATLAGSPWR